MHPFFSWCVCSNGECIHSSLVCFAAILDDGRDLADAALGTDCISACSGDCSAVRGRLGNAKHLQSSSAAPVAILDDGSAVTWAMLHLGRIASLYKSSWQMENASILQLVCLLKWRMHPFFTGVFAYDLDL
jgi:hypothetical protein